MALKVEFKSCGVRYFSFVDFDESDAEILEQNFKFHELDIEDCLSEQERPKIDEYPSYLFLVLQVPFYDRRDGIVETSEVNIFVGSDYFILSHDHEIDWIKKLEKEFENLTGRKEYFENGTGYLLYRIVEGLFESTFKVLDRLNREIRTLEREIFKTKEMRDRLEDIMLLKKSLINFRRTISPQRSVISQLEHKNKKFIKDDLEVYFDDVVDIVEKIWQNLEVMKEIVDTLETTNENLISHYTNNTMRLLTIMSVIMLPMTFITGIYGMNIGLPLEEDPFAFIFVTGGMLALLMGMLIFFRKKRWL